MIRLTSDPCHLTFIPPTNMHDTQGFIYNITTQVSWAIHDEWLQWLKDEYTTEIMATKCFNSFRILRLHEIDDAEGPTYATQFFATSKALYNSYIQLHSSAIRQKAYTKWGNQFMSFHSIMEIVQ